MARDSQPGSPGPELILRDGDRIKLLAPRPLEATANSSASRTPDGDDSGEPVIAPVSAPATSRNTPYSPDLASPGPQGA